MVTVLLNVWAGLLGLLESTGPRTVRGTSQPGYPCCFCGLDGSSGIFLWHLKLKSVSLFIHTHTHIYVREYVPIPLHFYSITLRYCLLLKYPGLPPFKLSKSVLVLKPPIYFYIFILTTPFFVILRKVCSKILLLGKSIRVFLYVSLLIKCLNAQF